MIGENFNQKMQAITQPTVDTKLTTNGVDELTDEEVKRRLRIRGEPLCYFGETMEDIRRRLRNLDRLEPIEYDKTEENVQKQVEKRHKQGTFTCSDDINVSEEQNETQETQIPQPLENMTPAQQKLFQLRLRLNEARKKNMEELVKEEKYRLSKETPAKKFWKSKKRIREEEAAFDITAEKAEEIIKKREKKAKKHNPYGWEIFNQEVGYNSHKKRTKNIGVSLEEYEKLKQEKGEQLYPTADSTIYGTQEHIPEKNLNRMVKELKEFEAKRANFSRRRAVYEEEDITYVTEKNRRFNKKLARSFDKYTAEIKQNLERGTAL